MLGLSQSGQLSPPRIVVEFIAALCGGATELGCVRRKWGENDAEVTCHWLAGPHRRNRGTGRPIDTVEDAGLPAEACPDVGTALAGIAREADPALPPVVLVTGSLYLAGAALAANGQTAG